MGEMHPDLMGASRFKFDTYIGMCGESMKYRVVRHGRLAYGPNTHAFAVNPVATNRLIDRAPTGQHSITDGDVMA